MKNVHFFKAKSRMGLKNIPVRQSELNLGVEEAPDYILTQDFLRQFQNCEVNEFVFPNPEDIKDKYNQVLAQKLKNFSSFIKDNLKSNQIQIIIGGDNIVTFSSILADLDRITNIESYGYIQFDSHGESNLNSTSPSGNFHGMYMRPFFDKFDISEIEKLVSNKLLPKQALFFGDMILDGDEPEFFKKKQLRIIDRASFLAKKEAIKQELKEFLRQFKFIHINFDIDVFDRSEAGATGIPEDGKWFWAEIGEILEIIKDHSSFSFDLCEVNPKKEGAEKTILTAQKILQTVLS